METLYKENPQNDLKSGKSAMDERVKTLIFSISYLIRLPEFRYGQRQEPQRKFSNKRSHAGPPEQRRRSSAKAKDPE